MFERFTDGARKAVVLAQEEARMLNHDYIGTEHILLGVIHEGEGRGGKALESLGISLEAVRRKVEELVGQGQAVPPGHIPFTPRAKKVLELSLREAVRLGHEHIGTEHILLGLIREGEGVAAQALKGLGGSLGRVRRTVEERVAGARGAEEVAAERVEQGARCAGCGALLAESAAHAVHFAPPSEGEGTPVPAVFVFCRACGQAVGVLPPESG